MAARKRILVPTEYQECKAYYQWTQLQPILRGKVIHIPNEGSRSPIGGRRLKDIGMVSGIPDYLIIVPNARFGALWVEMKRNVNFPRRESQDYWIDKLIEAGHCACYAKGADAAIEITLAYLANKL